MARNNSTCTGPGCDRRVEVLGLCRSHDQQRRLGKELTPLRSYTRKPPRVCSFPECGREGKARGLCNQHLNHLKRYGELRPIKRYDLHGVCEMAGCDEPAYAKKRCYKHCSYGYNLSRFSLTLEGFLQMRDEQGGVCAICGGVNANGKALSVDHDHDCCEGDRSCGSCIRGLLCSNCNFATGLMKDDPDRLEAASTYIRTHRAQRLVI
jgi:Recombination endonuclease VII